MKAITQYKYGGVETLQLENVEKPIIKDYEFLVEVHAVNIASGDMRVNTMDAPAIFKPLMKILFGFKGPRNKIRGISASGKIVEVGKNITKFKVGDEVYFINSMKASCLAEYVALNEKSIIATKPNNISFTDVAPISFGALSAYHFINEKNIKEQNKVVIYGASGSVGSYALQLAKYYGAEATAISSEKNHEKLELLGADHLIDYKKNDFRELNKKYDVIFDAVGKISKSSCKNVLQKQGKFLSIKLPTKESVERLYELNKIIEEGKLTTLIDTIYPMSKFKEAHEKTYSGHKVGNVIIDIKKEG